MNITEKWHIVKPGIAEQQKKEYQNTKPKMVTPGYRIPNPGQTISSASHANKSRLVDSSVYSNIKGIRKPHVHIS